MQRLDITAAESVREPLLGTAAPGLTARRRTLHDHRRALRLQRARRLLGLRREHLDGVFAGQVDVARPDRPAAEGRQPALAQCARDDAGARAPQAQRLGHNLEFARRSRGLAQRAHAAARGERRPAARPQAQGHFEPPARHTQVV